MTSIRGWDWLTQAQQYTAGGGRLGPYPPHKPEEEVDQEASPQGCPGATAKRCCGPGMTILRAGVTTFEVAHTWIRSGAGWIDSVLAFQHLQRRLGLQPHPLACEQDSRALASNTFGRTAQPERD